MLPTEIEFRNFYKKDARFVKKLKDSLKLEDIGCMMLWLNTS